MSRGNFIAPGVVSAMISDVTTPCPKADLAPHKDMANYLQVFILVLLSYNDNIFKLYSDQVFSIFRAEDGLAFLTIYLSPNVVGAC